MSRDLTCPWDGLITAAIESINSLKKENDDLFKQIGGLMSGKMEIVESLKDSAMSWRKKVFIFNQECISEAEQVLAAYREKKEMWLRIENRSNKSQEEDNE